MIRQRFGSGRLSRIAAWALAAVTAAAAILDNQLAAADEKAGPPTAAPPVGRFAATAVTIPTAPADGLLILRYRPAPAVAQPSAATQPSAVEQPATSRPAAAAPAPPPPPPARLPAPPPLQSSGS